MVKQNNTKKEGSRKSQNEVEGKGSILKKKGEKSQKKKKNFFVEIFTNNPLYLILLNYTFLYIVLTWKLIRLSKNVEKSISWFGELESLDIETKEFLIPQIRSYETINFVSISLLVLFVIAPLTILIYYKAITNDLYQDYIYPIFYYKVIIVYSKYEFPIFAVISALFLSFIPYGIFLKIILNIKLGLAILLLLLVFTISISMTLLINLYFISEIYFFQFAAVTAALFFAFSFFLTIIMLIPLILLSFFKSILFKMISIYNPDLTITFELSKTLYEVEKNQESWMNLEFKGELISMIEMVSICFERYLVSKLAPKDDVTDMWLKEKYEGFAANFRSIKKLIALSGPNSREELIIKISKSLKNIAFGNWEKLEWTEPVEVEKKEIWYSRIIYSTKILFISLFPIILFAFFQYAPKWFPNLTHWTPFKETMETNIWGGTILWAALTFIINFDPLLGQKISTFKEVISIIPKGSND